VGQAYVRAVLHDGRLGEQDDDVGEKLLAKLIDPGSIVW
jgi:hypothetical protein